MTNPELRQQLDRLKALFEKARDMTEDLDLQGHWGRYLCVLAAGFLENAIREVYADRARRHASRDIASFVMQSLDRIQSPKAQRFIDVAATFDKDWGQLLEDFLSEDDSHRKNAIDSIINNRHLIAHGRNASISVARVQEYLKASVEVIDFMEGQCA